MKKGFTLIELLAVLSILALMAGIAIPIINDLVIASREGSYKNQIAIIEDAANKWAVTHDTELEDEFYLSLDTLVEAGLINTKDIYDPRDEEKLEGCVKVTYNNTYNQREYEFITDCPTGTKLK